MVNNIFERKKINLEKVVKKSNNLMNKLKKAYASGFFLA